VICREYKVLFAEGSVSHIGLGFGFVDCYLLWLGIPRDVDQVIEGSYFPDRLCA
jgi:hypothetical protein